MLEHRSFTHEVVALAPLEGSRASAELPEVGAVSHNRRKTILEDLGAPAETANKNSKCPGVQGVSPLSSLSCEVSLRSVLRGL